MTNQLRWCFGKRLCSKPRDLNDPPPALPWPLPVGIFDLEVTHWPYEATSGRKAGEWHYFVHMVVSEDLLLLRGLRTRGSVIRYDRHLQLVHGEIQLKINRKARHPSVQLVNAFESFVRRLRHEAQHQQKRYMRARNASLTSVTAFFKWCFEKHS